jgi:hypothetical protein
MESKEVVDSTAFFIFVFAIDVGHEGSHSGGVIRNARRVG